MELAADTAEGTHAEVLADRPAPGRTGGKADVEMGGKDDDLVRPGNDGTATADAERVAPLDGEWTEDPRAPPAGGQAVLRGCRFPWTQRRESEVGAPHATDRFPQGQRCRA